MKRTLIFCDYIGGHQMEYLHHLYMHVLNKRDNQFFFAVPRKRFQEDSCKFKWPESENIRFIYLQDVDLVREGSHYLFNSFFKSRLLFRTIKETGAVNVLLIELIGFLPWLPFMIYKGIEISGILYKINLYRRKGSNIFILLQDILKERLFVHFSVFTKIFILNDNEAKDCLNKMYKVEKFYFLPDPVVPIQQSSLRNLRSEYEIDLSKIVLLHPGGPEKRKGSIEIFRAIERLSQDIRNQYTFIFAGRVTEDIKKDFYDFYTKLKNVVQIIVIDEFCSYELLGSLYFTCDGILIPYKETAQSSGTIGYAAQFRKPVITPKLGLIGKIVESNNLGVLLDGSTCDAIIYYLEHPVAWEYVQNDYLVTNSVSEFCNSISL